MPKGTGLNLDETQVADVGETRYSKRHSIKRNAVSVTCTIAVEGGEDDIFHGVLEDISSTGIRMSTNYPLEKGVHLELAFDVDGATQVRKGEIMWVRIMGAMYKAGARFIEPSDSYRDIEIREGVSFSCEYKLNASHSAQAQVIAITNVGITFVTEEILSIGTMLEILVNPWSDERKEVFDISFVDVFKLTDQWQLWDLHKVAKVSKAKQVGPGECHIEAVFIADKKR